LLVAQVLASGIGFWALARGLTEEAPAGTVAVVSTIVLAGSLASVVVVGVSLYSLALFPLILLLLEAESRAPSWRLWLAVPLLAAWGNLHGEVLAGWALTCAYLAFERARRELRLALGVFAAATLALFLNPVLWHTAEYYRGVLGNEAAREGVGLWEPFRVGGLDLFLLAAAVTLLTLALAGREIRLWEGVALAGLALATIQVARTGTWFLFVAAYPAARRLHLRAPVRLLRMAAVVFAAASVALLIREPKDPGSKSLAQLAAASGRPVLAEALLGQQVALAGGRTWVDNPIDAFRRRDQRIYLSWLNGAPAGAAAIPHAGYVLVTPGSKAAAAARRDPRLVLVAENGSGVLYRRK
jgi:hypothetical protein